MDLTQNSFLMALIGIIPGFVWLIFFLREDFRPEPKKLIFFTFFVGAIFSLPVFFSQLIFQKTASFLGLAGGLLFVIGLAVIEEVFKFLAAYLAISGNKNFDEPIDAMIYIIAAALGFATVENIFIAVTADSVLETAKITSLRFVGATLLHALTAGLIGYQWALGISRNQIANFVLRGVIYAVIIHAFFNHFVLKFEENNLFYAAVVILAAAFFVFMDFEKLRRKS